MAKPHFCFNSRMSSALRKLVFSNLLNNSYDHPR
jgi:hypothetical protein